MGSPFAFNYFNISSFLLRWGTNSFPSDVFYFFTSDIFFMSIGNRLVAFGSIYNYKTDLLIAALLCCRWRINEDGRSCTLTVSWIFLVELAWSCCFVMSLLFASHGTEQAPIHYAEYWFSRSKSIWPFSCGGPSFLDNSYPLKKVSIFIWN